MMSYLCHANIGKPIVLQLQKNISTCLLSIEEGYYNFFFQKNKLVQQGVEQTENVC